MVSVLVVIDMMILMRNTLHDTWHERIMAQITEPTRICIKSTESHHIQCHCVVV